MINQNIEINDYENDLNSLLECQYCGEFFSKYNKPLILKCSHNICQACHELNLSRLTCLICNTKFKLKENKRYPINFLLLEIIERTIRKDSDEKKEKKLPSHKYKHKKSKSHKGQGNLNLPSHNKENENEPPLVYNCIQCELIFPNLFHFEKFTDHKMIEVSNNTISEEKSRLIQASQELMLKYKNFNEKLEKSNDAFFEFLNERIKATSLEVIDELKRDSNVLDNFLMFGLINKGDKEKLSEFIMKYLSDDNILKSIKKSKTFDEFLFNLKKIKDFKINHFISSYFYFEDILENKLKIDFHSKSHEFIEEKVGTFISKLDGNDEKTYPDDIKSLFKYFLQDLNVEAYDCLDLEKDLKEKFKIPAILTNKNELVYFDPLIEKIKTITNLSSIFPSMLETLKDYSYYLDSNYTLYISGGKTCNDSITNINSDFFSINLISNKLIILANMPEPRYNHSTILIKNKLYIIGGKNDADIPIKTCYKYNIKENAWIKIQNSPYEFIEKPFLVNFENEFIYALEDLKHFFYYDISSDRWTVCNPTYKDAFNLNLVNFLSIYLDGNLLLLGGRYKTENGDFISNKDIYHIKDIGSLITKKGEFKIISTSSSIEYGYVIGHHYLLEYDELEDRAKVYKTKDLSSLKWDNLKNN